MTTTFEEVVEKIKIDVTPGTDDELLAQAETSVYKLSDAIREGSAHSQKAVGWGHGNRMCALTSAYAATKARGYTD